MADFNLTKMALNMYCPGNVVELDDAGLPSVMVWIPAFKNSDVLTGGDDSIHPAFIVNGVQIAGFYYSKYQNVVYNGKAYSMPAEDPLVMINHDEARKHSEAKGYGWHLSTAAEWAAIALWCKKNEYLPYGNNYYGKDVRETDYKAIQSSSEHSRMATGTGPLTWSHDKTPAGVWDMNGNVWEWQGGLRLVWGELQILANNDAADPDNPQNATSTCWKAINAADGSLVEPESKTTDTASKASGSTVKLDYVGNVWKFSTGISSATSTNQNCIFGQVTCTDGIGDAAKVLLRAMALLPDVGATAADYESDLVYWDNNQAERFIARGGAWNLGNSSGVYSIYTSGRANTAASIGFRSAYIPYIG